MRFAFAGDRDIAVWTLGHILDDGHRPLALMISEDATHGDALISLSGIPNDLVFRGNEFRQPDAIERLAALDLDMIVGIHFPRLSRSKSSTSPNTDSSTCTLRTCRSIADGTPRAWAILDDTPVGATLHLMAEDIDAGDIIHQRQLDVSPSDTADSLYARLKQLELDVFIEAWPDLVAGNFTRTPQNTQGGSSHVRSDLLRDEVRRIDLDGSASPEQLLRQLRALTTNDITEAAFFESDGKRYRVQISVEEVD